MEEYLSKMTQTKPCILYDLNLIDSKKLFKKKTIDHISKHKRKSLLDIHINKIKNNEKINKAVTMRNLGSVKQIIIKIINKNEAIKNKLENSITGDNNSSLLILNKNIAENIKESNCIDNTNILMKNYFVKHSLIAEDVNHPHNNLQKTKYINESTLPDQICIICDQYKNLKFLIKIGKCKHSLCFKCAKNFYEEKIESGEVELYCPVFRCKEKVDDKEIQVLISNTHYQSFLNNKSYLLLNNSVSGDKFEELIREQIKYQENNKETKFQIEKNNYSKINSDFIVNVRNSSINTNNKSIKKIENLSRTNLTNNMIESMQIVQDLSKKHVLELSVDDDKYVLFNKLKEKFCIKCTEPALYGKYSCKVVKCMNCYFTFCKYCMKLMTEDHFNISDEYHCKIYFKKYYNNNKLDSIYLKLENEISSVSKKILLKILKTCISYLLVTAFIYLKLNMYFKLSLCKYKCKYLQFLGIILILFFKLISVLIVFVISIMILPYFPIINTLFQI